MIRLPERDDAAGCAGSQNTIIASDVIVRRFVDEWRRGASPTIDQFICNFAGAQRQQLLIALVQAEMSQRIGHDPAVSLEQYLSRFPELGTSEQVPVALVLAEYAARLRAGRSPDLAEYARRFPRQISALRAEIEHGSSSECEPLGTGRMGGLQTIRGVHAPLQEPGPPRPATGPPEPATLSRVSIGSRRPIAKSSDPLALLGNTVLGDFRIVRTLGSGALSGVYLARQVSLDRLVALKVSYSSSAYSHDEARTLAGLEHDHIVPVYTEQVLGELRLMAMRYIPGVTLAWLMERLAGRSRRGRNGGDLLRYVDRELGVHDSSWDCSERDRLGRLSFVRAVCHIVAGLARGLDYAHRHGILHRDIKPANILMAPSGRAMLMDFNVSARAAAKGDAANAASVPTRCTGGAQSAEAGGGDASIVKTCDHDRPSASDRTYDDAVLGGTPAYMAPEHLAAMTPQLAAMPSVVDERSDVYSLGVVFYELLSGHHPFPLAGDSSSSSSVAMQLLGARMRGPSPVPRDAVRVTVGLDSILEKCLAPDPNERYQSAGQLAEDLQCYLEHRPLRNAADPSWSERAIKWLRCHPSVVVAAATVAVMAVAATTRQAWQEYQYMSRVEGLISRAYRQHNAGHIAAAFETAAEADRLVDRSSVLLPLLGFGKRHAALATQVQRIPWVLTTSQYGKFSHYSGIARGGLRLRTMRAAAELDSPALQALSFYHVLERPDWQQLPQFQLLDPLSQTRVEEEATEMLLMRAVELLQVGRFASISPDEPQSVAELISRVPMSQQARYAVTELKQKAEGTADASHLTPSMPQEEWEAIDLYLSGVVAAKRGEFERAIRFFDSALDRPPDVDPYMRYWSHFHRAYCAEQSGNTDLAIADYGACIGLNGRDAGSHHNLGLIYARQEKFELAAKYLRDAARRGGAWSVSCLVNLAAAELKLGNFSAALDAADEAISLDDRCAEAYANRGAARAAMGQREAALSDIKRALALDPECAAARQNLELLNPP